MLDVFKKYYLLTVLIAVASSIFAQAPGCPDIDAGPDQSLDCTSNCTNLTATVLQTGETTTYTVSSIPYAPPSVYTAGTQLLIGTDDIWGDAIDLGFNFCFFGNMYSQAVVGANGLISFDIAEANQYCEWSYDASCPTPGPPPGGLYNNSIMGAYHDIDPSEGGEIRYALLGSAPCRTLVVNFNDIPHYSCDCGFLSSCSKTTQQIVIYETTNVIEVYIEQKELCSGWNDGNATIGIQNSDGSVGFTPPGRNTGAWSASNEAWRFTPNGAPSYTVNWYDGSSTLVGTGLTLNVCPTSTTTYTGEAVYQHCDGSQVIVTDQVTLNVTGGFTTSQTNTPESCAGNCDGEVTVTANGGTPPYSFDIGNGNQANGSFTGLCAGNYTVTVSDGGGCNGTVNVVIGSGGTISVTEAYTDETCMGADDGTITLVGSGGTQPYGYDIGFGPPNTTGVFTNLPPNNYNYTVIDPSQCPTTGVITIAAGPNCCAMTNTDSSTDPLCNGACDGTITLTESNGNAPVTFSIDNGTTTQATGDFTGLCAGTYDILITDANNCQYTDQVTLTDPPILSTSAIATDANCNVCDGTVTITAQGGDGGPYLFSVDSGITFQNSGNFTNICPGDIDVIVEDASGCWAGTATNINQISGPAITGFQSTDATCNGACDGSIDITATGADQYSVDGINYQVSPSFIGLCAGTYDAIAEDANGCQAIQQIIISEPSAVTFNVDITFTLCNGSCDGSIEVTANGGTPPYQYSNDNGGTFQGNNIFTNLCAGSYDLVVTDANGCTVSKTEDVLEPTALTLDLVSTDPTCFGDCDGNASVSISGGTPPYTYLWSTGETIDKAQDLCDGAYDIVVTDANGCIIDMLGFPITQPAAMVIDNITPIDETCFDDCTGSIEIEASQATFFSIDGGITFSNSSIFTGLCDGDYQIVVQNNDGCKASGITKLNTPVQVIAGFDAHPTITTEIDPLIEFTNESSGATFYYWTFGDGGEDTTNNVNYDYNNGIPGTYTACLEASNENGCTDSVCVTIIITEIFTLYVPSAFTPNSDGLNDEFYPIFTGEQKDTYVMRIFNRWGEEVFYTNDKTKTWDGYIGINPAQEDVYNWKIYVEPNDGKDAKEYIGRVALLR